MNIKKWILPIGILALIYACGKDDAQSGYLEPIKIVLPSDNPATIIKGDPINYKVTCTHDNYIDSFKIYYQTDSTLTGYVASNDTIIRRDSIFVADKKNIMTFEGVYQPWYFPAVGRKLYMTFRFFSTYETIISGVKTTLKDSTDKRLTLIVS